MLQDMKLHVKNEKVQFRPLVGDIFISSDGMTWGPLMGSWGSVPDPYGTLMLTEEGRWRIARGVSHVHEAWESCQACVVSEVMET